MSHPQVQGDCPLPKVTQQVRDRAMLPLPPPPGSQSQQTSSPGLRLGGWGLLSTGAPHRTKQGNWVGVGGGFVRTKARDPGWEWSRAGFPKEAVGGDRSWRGRGLGRGSSGGCCHGNQARTKS